MLGFNQDEYLTSAREIIAARKQAETVADDIYDSGCSALRDPLIISPKRNHV
ncbi:glucosamine--fructose-6-phosphate aminotransferase [Klebsiella pneumoniae]|nr:glucosamine--fructose-6-phosphate aminotransferase [Klebsiella pneumoniae]SXH38044.1 glucosamine--fructose-6-phosphate aminotransferase [Klebsiella pneumoniae]